MALTARLQQKQSQSLVMTPQLAQSIKMLQLGHEELAQFVQAEIEKNPLLEIDPESSLIGKERRKDRNSDGNVTHEQDNDYSSSKEIGEMLSRDMTITAGENEAGLDANFDNVYDGGTAGAERVQKSKTEPKAGSDPNTSGAGTVATDSVDIAALAGEKQSLSQYLKSQIVLAFKVEKHREIANYIAHGLTEDGYFQESLDDVASIHGTKVEVVEAVLEQFQTLEPVGIGARNLSECLSLQLKEKNRFDPAMERLLDHLDLLAKREFDALMKICGVGREDFSGMVAEIRELDPRPAAKYEPDLAETVVPDVIVSQKPDGSWSIDLNSDTLPKVLVNREYHAELSSAVDTPEGKEFIADCLGNANWLTKSLDQRAQTILKVSTEIVKQQDMFFAKGIDHLRPLNLKTVADAIKMHESTVSRVTSNKYLMCDLGIFELKYFFSSSVSSNEGDEGMASESVKHRIRQLVEAESPAKILSDDQIVKSLQETGIEIARRTVAKYREAMRIPSSVQRRREKKNRI